MTSRPIVPLERESLRQMLDHLRNQETRKVGSVIEFVEGKDRVKVATDTDRKLCNGGIDRGRFLVMIPVGAVAEKTIPHFQLLRKTWHSDTPTSQQYRQEQWAGEQQKKAINNEVSISDMNHEIFECSALGAFVERNGKIEFIDEPGDMQSAINYAVYAPDAAILNLIVNLIAVGDSSDPYFRIGNLRESEAGSKLPAYKQETAPVYVTYTDFISKRTGIFGKTTKGKSNVAKNIMLNMNRTVSQLVFDIGGEYCNPNPKDNGRIFSDMIPNSVVFGLSAKPEHPDRRLVCPDFYQYPKVARQKLLALLIRDKRDVD